MEAKGLNSEIPRVVNFGIQAFHIGWKNNWTNSRKFLSAAI